MQSIIIKPLVTEKTMQSSGPAKYTFMVDGASTKTEIKKAIKDAFQVHVVSISTTKIKGKRKKIGKRRVEAIEQATKKAIIRLKKGEKITFLESVEETDKKKKK